jgi:hypothetical protein
MCWKGVVLLLISELEQLQTQMSMKKHEGNMS